MANDQHITFKKWLGFHAAWVVPFSFAGAIGLSILFNDPAIGSSCWTATCWANFVYFFKIPIAIAGLAIPLVGVAAAIHRSEETAIQIRHSQRQFEEALSNNKFSNYIKHRDSFISLLSAHQNRALQGPTLLQLDASALYEKIYPSNDYTYLEFYSNSEVNFWSILRSRLKNLLNLRALDLNGFSHEGYASEVILAFAQTFQILDITFKDGYKVKGIGHRSGMQTEFVMRAELLLCISATIDVVFDTVQALNIISGADCDFDELHSQFDGEWKRDVARNMYGGFQEA